MPRPYRLKLAVAVDNGQTPVFAEGPGGYLDPRGGLAALVFVAVNGGNDLTHRLRVKAHLHHFLIAVILLHVSLDDGVQFLIGRQGIIISLAWFQFGAGGLADNGLRDYPGRLAVLVAPLAELVH